MSVLVWFICFVAVVALIGVWEWYFEKRDPKLPGPKGYPFIYNMIEPLQNKHRLHDFDAEKFRILGPIYTGRLSFTFPRVIFIISPEDVDHVLRKNWRNFPKGPFFKEIFQALMGDGIFNVDGEHWHQQRQIASHMFSIKELKDMFPIFEKHVKELLQIFEEKMEQNVVVDLQDFFSRLTLDSITHIAFGTEINSLRYQVPFSRSFNTATAEIVERLLNPFWKWFPWLKSERQLKEAIQTINSFAYSIIESRKKEQNLEQKVDLLSRYLCRKDLNGQDFTDQYLRDIIMNFLLAGRDTTAATLTWCFYLLSKNQRVQAKLLEEINSFCPDGNLPDYDGFKQMKYLQAVIDETLRLYPPVPSDLKTVLEDDVLPSGYKVYQGQNIVWHAWGMGRSELYWDSPLEFKPERWFGENGSFALPKGNQPPFIPFQFGPRTCLGINFAYLEVKIAICLILQKFSFQLEAREDPTYTLGITLSMKDGLPVRIQSRNSQQ